MKLQSQVLLIALLVSFAVVNSSFASSALPFSVSIDGVELQYKGGLTYVKVESEVSPNATIQVGSDAPMVIANIFKSDDNGVVATGTQPEIIMVNNSPQFKLNQTMSNNTLGAGTYLMNIMAGSTTARILFKIK